MTLSEIATVLQFDAEDRSGLLIMLNDLMDAKQAEFDMHNGVWSSNVIIE